VSRVNLPWEVTRGMFTRLRRPQRQQRLAEPAKSVHMRERSTIAVQALNDGRGRRPAHAFARAPDCVSDPTSREVQAARRICLITSANDVAEPLSVGGAAGILRRAWWARISCRERWSSIPLDAGALLGFVLFAAFLLGLAGPPPAGRVPSSKIAHLSEERAIAANEADRQGGAKPAGGVGD
jgi:hypothetical protein